MSYLIEEKEIGDHRIQIYYDEDAQCPATNWDLVGVFLWEYNDRWRHTLSKECNWEEVFGKNNYDNQSLDYALRQLVCEYVEWKDLLKYIKAKKLDGYMMEYDRSERVWKLERKDYYAKNMDSWYSVCEATPSDLKNYDYTWEFTENMEKDDLLQILRDLGKDVVFHEWSTTGYCQGDYVEGIAYCDIDRFRKMWGEPDKDWKEKAVKCMEGSAEEIGMWMWGDVKGYILEKKVSYTKVFDDDDERDDEDDFDWEEVHSCWGFFMETEELIEEIISEWGLKETEAA